MDVGESRKNDELDWRDRRHHPRHAVGHAGEAVVDALSAVALVGHAGLENLLVFGPERRLLREPWTLALIPLNSDSARPQPLAAPVWVFGFVECRGAGRRR